MTPIKTPKKLIEVALPLDDINTACAREKSIRHGHPSTLHLWWARRPLAAARAVIFAQMVNDPGYETGKGFTRGVNKERAAVDRERLFDIIKDLVKWENTNNETVLQRARDEIRKSWVETCALNKGHPEAAQLFNPEVLPAFHDPFAGGGGIPLEAQRLGLVTHASDLNPVAVTINKAMIEVPPLFVGRAPVGPIPSDQKQTEAESTQDWQGAKGLAEDVRRYGAWMREQAQQRIGHLYPKVEITSEMAVTRPDLKQLVGQKLTVIAWLWARTVKSPNPAFAHVNVPLASTFVLASKSGKEAYVHPVIDGESYSFSIKMEKPPTSAKGGTRAEGGGANFLCLLSQTPIVGDYIRSEGQAGRIGERLMAVVLEGIRTRVYLAPSREMEELAAHAKPTWKPDVEFFQQALGFRIGNYGLSKWSDLFTSRQLAALGTLAELAEEVKDKCARDAAGKFPGDDASIANGGSGAVAYGEAVAFYLSIFVSRMVNLNNSFCQWRNDPAKEHVGHMFSRQAISMVWDFAEANPLGNSGGSFDKTFDFVPKVLPFLYPYSKGFASQADAASQGISVGKVISTDPPYYDNIGYADLSDFFYVWLRRTLKPIYPALFATLTVPKADELVATPARHGGKQQAEKYFLDGMTRAMHALAEQGHPAFPVTIYYAFKSSETSGETGTTSTGWETFLAAVLKAGFAISGTWPMRTELGNRMRGSESNALASSIVLVCRKRDADAPSLSRRDFIRELNTTLPIALDEMTRGGINSPVVPVDLSQAIIGPGMAIFSRYSAVLEPNGTPMSVRSALQLFGGGRLRRRHAVLSALV